MPGSRGCAEAFRSAGVPAGCPEGILPSARGRDESVSQRFFRPLLGSLAVHYLPTLRRGLYSCAASRLFVDPLRHFCSCPKVATQSHPALRSRAGRPRDSRQDAGATLYYCAAFTSWAADTDPAVLRTAGTIDGLETFEREWVRTAREKRTLLLPAAVPTADHPQVKQNDADSGWRRRIQPDHIPSRAAPSFKSAPCAPLKGPPWCPEITTVTCRS